jgi:hypothetical protein
VTFGQDAAMRRKVITFDVVDFVYPYNAIFVRNTINKFTAVIHQGYLLMKIPTAVGVIRCTAAKRRLDGLSGTLQCITGRCTLSMKMRAAKLQQK